MTSAALLPKKPESQWLLSASRFRQMITKLISCCVMSSKFSFTCRSLSPKKRKPLKWSSRRFMAMTNSKLPVRCISGFAYNIRGGSDLLAAPEHPEKSVWCITVSTGGYNV